MILYITSNVDNRTSSDVSIDGDDSPAGHNDGLKTKNIESLY